jgi:formylglycine-generating enzyme required for sulfatase activity
MNPSSLRAPALVSLTLIASAVAQGATANKSAAAAAPASANGAKADAQDTDGLPSFLLPVPGGVVEMGLDANAFVQAASQVALPSKPENALKVAPAVLNAAMRRSASVLGRKKVEVPSFLLGKFPVTNAQYEAFVAARRKDGKYHAPFHWWRFGRSDDYNAKLGEINQLFPKNPEGPLNFWDRFGGELPYKVADAKGNSIGEQPVTYVSFRAANEFAGWLGMRLPTEAEFTRAARGDGKATWPLAKADDPASDRFSEQMLKDLRMATTADKANKPVGTVAAAAGAFGHMDMFGQVWQLLGDKGYRPINGREAFEAEWKNLMKDKAGEALKAPPAWKDELVIAKGGSFLSSGEPIQLMIDARAPMQTIDVLESVGFRLAKSLKPGYDAMYSALRGTFNKGVFGIDQQIDLTAQVGAERYELDASGFPTSYATVTFAPVNWLSKDKNPELGKLLDQSQASPLLVGALMTTSPMTSPAAPAGLYSVLYRKAGVPRELVDAVKMGHKELVAAQKQKGDKPEAEEDKKDDKKQDKKKAWRDVTSRFGFTDEDLLSKDAADGNLKFLRMDGCQVPVNDDVFLLYGNEGKVVAAWPAPNAKPALAAAAPSALSIEANDKGKAVAKFRFGAPIAQGNAKKVADVQLHITLDRDAPSAEKPWRLPAAAPANGK